MRFIILLISILVTSLAFGQQKETSIELEDGKSFINISTNKETGDFFILSAKKSVSVVVLVKNNKLLKLDKNLNKIFEVDIENKQVGHAPQLTKDLNYYLINKEIVDDEGNVREYPDEDNFFKNIVKESEINPIFKFFGDYGYTILGPMKGRKNWKRKYEEGDLFIYNLKNKDFVSEKNPFKLLPVKTQKKYNTWFLLKSNQTKDSFYLTLIDDFIDKNYNENVYHFAEYNYDGSIKSHTKINFKLDEGKNFLPTIHSNGPTAYTEASNNSDIAYASCYIDESDNSIILYGYYSNKNGKQIRTGKLDGIYAYKFSKETGELIWKSYQPFSKTKSNYLIERKISFKPCGNYAVLHCYLEDESAFFRLNLKEGKFESNNSLSSLLADFFHKDKTLKEDDYFLNLKMYMGGRFWRTFKDKKTNKNKIDVSILEAIILKPEIKQFILDKTKDKTKTEYSSEIIENGDVFILEEMNKKTLNIYKF